MSSLARETPFYPKKGHHILYVHALLSSFDIDHELK